MKPQGLVAQNNTYRQLHNCHNNVKSEIQAKFFQVGAKVNVRVKKGFF